MRLPNAVQWPSGDLRSIYLHWTGGHYDETFDAYHFCIAWNGAEIECVATRDLRGNMRDVRAGGDYAAHTLGRNSFAIGIAVCGMRDATPSDFGIAPLREEQLEAACALAASLLQCYAIPLENVRTHAEAALDDGYFGCDEGCRWDIARFRAAAAALAPNDAVVAGNALRARVRRSDSHGS